MLGVARVGRADIAEMTICRATERESHLPEKSLIAPLLPCVAIRALGLRTQCATTRTQRAMENQGHPPRQESSQSDERHPLLCRMSVPPLTILAIDQKGARGGCDPSRRAGQAEDLAMDHGPYGAARTVHLLWPVGCYDDRPRGAHRQQGSGHLVEFRSGLRRLQSLEKGPQCQALGSGHGPTPQVSEGRLCNAGYAARCLRRHHEARGACTAGDSGHGSPRVVPPALWG